MSPETAPERLKRLRREAAQTRQRIQKQHKLKAKTAEQIKRERKRIKRQQARVDKRKRKIDRLGDRRRRLARRIAHLIRVMGPVFVRSMLGGHPMVAVRLAPVIAYAVIRFHLVVTSTGGGVHEPGSWHYTRPPRAVDLAAAMTAAGIARMKAFQRFAAGKWGPSLLELFGPDDFYISGGVRISGAFPDHGDHVHAAK